MPAAYLPERRFVRVSGPDAEPFLQNLITTDLPALAAGEARPGALLTPQGKILFDFTVWRDGDALVLETDVSQQDALLRRLTMYKLRAPVEIALLQDEGTTVTWGEHADEAGPADLRFTKAGIRLVRRPGPISVETPVGDYDALRIEAGVAVSGADFALQDAFPHDVLMDLNCGLSFRKGCYVGQEVVSRMQHRGTARRRLAIIRSDSDLPATGTPITAGGKPVGALGTVSGNAALAIVRIDRIGAALAAGVPLIAGDLPVTASLPDWSGLAFPAGDDEADA
ncbi:YgfZ/GcvT domain-containing protein [Pseudorhizobium pelagicum]|uniref:Aminomethyltransferase n=1 Tax=Pseudorhizobium pelagicum TaxID=1509405 RepID=A0A922P3R3_9HYPH|nr:folate-binding protein YgfZ [Pseudorhizobium pelagicum]KEQ04701.1 aminomethyltransferase [Pseudorhizobium pelagicum]KEQ06935.1 aminomethyltransferase [Pseudorhizobium pelagicum]